MLNKFVLMVLAVALKSSALTPPKEFVLCHRSDNEFQKCLVQAIGTTLNALASGNKELGLPDLTQLKVPSINIKGNGGAINLSQHYIDCVMIRSIDDPVIYAEAAFEKENCYIRYKAFVEVSEMIATYTAKGKMMMLEVNGHGNSNITLVNTVVWYNYTCRMYEKDGNEYLNFTDLGQDIAPEKVYIYFENFVDGNPELSAQVSQVINDNAMEVFWNVKEDVEKVYADIYKQIANMVFSQIPWTDIFLE